MQGIAFITNMSFLVATEYRVGKLQYAEFAQQGFSNDIYISRGKTRNLIGQWHYFKPV
jgi:hypothetical protein